MAALIDSKFVWSATLVIVVTTALMFSDFSRMMPSFAEIEAGRFHELPHGGLDSVRALRGRPWPGWRPASPARCTSSIVPASASLVAEISRTAAAISVVALESPCTVPSCCLAVAAISEEVESNCTLPSRTRCTTVWILAIMALIPAASSASSSLASMFTRAVRSLAPLAISLTRPMSFSVERVMLRMVIQPSSPTETTETTLKTSMTRIQNKRRVAGGLLGGGIRCLWMSFSALSNAC